MNALAGRVAARRWVHLVLGGALLMPYWILALVLVSAATAPHAELNLPNQLLAFACALPMAAVTALLPMVRALEGTAARALCAGAAGELVSTPSRSWAARRRTAAWYTLHLGLGGIVSGMSIAIPPAVVSLLFFPPDLFFRLYFGGHRPSAVLVAALLVLLLLLGNAGAGALLARLAPVLLGPTPAERLATAERRAEELAQRNRLARELHDSIGHALSAVGIQAAAAARVLSSDPQFAAEALRAIEDTARAAVGELDAVLGLLRHEEAPEAGPTLGELSTLLGQLERAGIALETSCGPGLADLPAAVSRAAYRIVQEGLTNVLRHAGPVPTMLRLETGGGRLTVELSNPVEPGRPSRPGGGRGLPGIAERAAALRGGCSAGPTEDGRGWRLTAWLPTSGGRA